MIQCSEGVPTLLRSHLHLNDYGSSHKTAHAEMAVTDSSFHNILQKPASNKHACCTDRRRRCNVFAYLHGVNVVLLGVAARQEEVGNWSGLIRPVWVHAWSFSVQTLTNLDYAVPRWLQTLG